MASKEKVPITSHISISSASPCLLGCTERDLNISMEQKISFYKKTRHAVPMPLNEQKCPCDDDPNSILNQPTLPVGEREISSTQGCYYAQQLNAPVLTRCRGHQSCRLLEQVLEVHYISKNACSSGVVASSCALDHQR